jgi:hypothetical protein
LILVFVFYFGIELKHIFDEYNRWIDEKSKQEKKLSKKEKNSKRKIHALIEK